MEANDEAQYASGVGGGGGANKLPPQPLITTNRPTARMFETTTPARFIIGILLSESSSHALDARDLGEAYGT
jgi:hypothetical protein